MTFVKNHQCDKKMWTWLKNLSHPIRTSNDMVSNKCFGNSVLFNLKIDVVYVNNVIVKKQNQYFRGVLSMFAIQYNQGWSVSSRVVDSVSKNQTQPRNHKMNS